MKSALLLLAVSLFPALAATALPTEMRTYSYYGYVYGQNGNYCNCQIGPCAPDLIGQKTITCDGSGPSAGAAPPEDDAEACSAAE